jgi:predicted DNA-binding transcriptional regulator YafY
VAVTTRIERLLNLTATLLDTRRPLTLEELAERLEPAYPSEKSARRRAFERDKETLRDLGVPIAVETVDHLGGEAGYRIHPSDYYLPELELTPEERSALHVAVTAVRLDADTALEGLRKLGGAEGIGAAPVAQLETSAVLPELFDAVAKRRPVVFQYRGEERALEPYGVVHRFGHWYVVGRDRERDAPRAFRADRIEGTPELGEPASFTPPPDTDPARFLRDDPLSYGEAPPAEARVLVDATRAALVVDELGDDAVVERRDDGSVVIVLSVVNRDAFRTWLLGLREHAEVLEPPELRVDVIAWLQDVVRATT